MAVEIIPNALAILTAVFAFLIVNADRIVTIPKMGPDERLTSILRFSFLSLFMLTMISFFITNIHLSNLEAATTTSGMEAELDNIESVNQVMMFPYAIITFMLFLGFLIFIVLFGAQWLMDKGSLK